MAAISGWHRPEVAFDPYQAPIAVLYFYLFRHDFSNSHRPEALWISHFDSLLQKVISPCRGGEGPSPVHLESPQGTVCRPS